MNQREPENKEDWFVGQEEEEKEGMIDKSLFCPPLNANGTKEEEALFVME